MRFVEAEEGLPLITQLSYKIDEDRCKLQWQWPEGIQAVYIDKRSAERARQGECRNPPAAPALRTACRYKPPVFLQATPTSAYSDPHRSCN